MSTPKEQQPKPRIKYKKVDAASGSEDNNDLEDANANTNTVTNEIETEQKRNSSQIRSCHDLYKYISHKPLTKLPFLYFFISIFVPFVLGIWYLMSADSTAYIVSGIFGVLTAVYALNHFRVLINLKVEVDKYSKLNRTFNMENDRLIYEVNKLSAACNTLQDTHEKFKTHNLKLKQNNRNFRSLQTALKDLNYDNIDGINSIRDKASKMSTDWNDKLIQRERDVLYKVFERFEKQNRSSDGMSREQFEDFLSEIPNAYKQRFDRLGTFKKLAKGKRYIDFKDFSACLDVFAIMHVEGCDIDFEITEVNEEDDDDDVMPTLQRQSHVKIKVNVLRKVFDDDDDDVKNDND